MTSCICLKEVWINRETQSCFWNKIKYQRNTRLYRKYINIILFQVVHTLHQLEANPFWLFPIWNIKEGNILGKGVSKIIYFQRTRLSFSSRNKCDSPLWQINVAVYYTKQCIIRCYLPDELSSIFNENVDTSKIQGACLSGPCHRPFTVTSINYLFNVSLENNKWLYFELRDIFSSRSELFLLCNYLH